MKINVANLNTDFSTENTSIENVNRFEYLDSVISTDGGANENVLARIAKAKGASVQLSNTSRSSFISTRTKLRVVN